MNTPNRNFLVLDIAYGIAVIVFGVLEVALNPDNALRTTVVFGLLLGLMWWFLRYYLTHKIVSEDEDERRRFEERQRRRLARLERRKSSARRVTRLRKGKDTGKQAAVVHRLRGQNTARTAFVPLETGLHVLRFTFPPDVTVSITLESADRQSRTPILSRAKSPESGHIDIESAGEYALTVELFGMAAINEWQIEIEAV